LGSLEELSKINFGYTSAETEYARRPDLLRSGFFELSGITDKVLNGEKCLVLGYKGSGKSAVSKRVQLLYEDDANHFVQVVNISDFRHTLLSQFVTESKDAEFVFPRAWGWILSAYVTASLLSDYGAASTAPSNWMSVRKVFSELGLTQDSNLEKIVSALDSTQQSFNLANIGGFSKSITPSDDKPSILSKLVDVLKIEIARVQTQSRHIIFIDGLDDLLTHTREQYSSLASLIYENARFNDFLFAEQVPVKIIVLCRTDIFEAIGGPNKNKVRQDSGFEIDWAGNPKQPLESALVQAANQRATSELKRSVDVFSEFLPPLIQKREAAKFLLEHTRHTPRDFFKLLNFIAEEAKTGKLDFVNAIRRYSQEYFYPEILDELDGYADPAEVEEVFELVGRLRSREFLIEDIFKMSGQVGSQLTTRKISTIMHALFECSAIGNVRQQRGRTSSYPIFTWRYRNRNKRFDEKESILLHKGLWRALNL
jgi:energy-coupling factor transporter ATP-binding protein EcfA2